MDQEQDQDHDEEQRDQHVPARGQDVVPLGLVRALLGQLQVPLGLLVPRLDGVDEGHEAEAAEVDVQRVAQGPDQVVPRGLLRSAAVHVDHGGARFTPGLAVGQRGAVGREVVRVVVHG